MLSDIFGRFRSLQTMFQILLALLGIVLSVALSPLVAVLALLGLIGSAFALVLGAIERKPLRRRGELAVTSLLLLVVFAGVSNVLYGVGTREQASAPAPQRMTTEVDAQNEKAEAGITSKAGAKPVWATYYGEELAGAPTASGEPYDPSGFTAAHPYLPLGTQLLVSYQDRSVVVTVNDRLPYGSGYDLDLSQAAAQDIGLIEAGGAVVDAEIVQT